MVSGPFRNEVTPSRQPHGLTTATVLVASGTKQYIAAGNANLFRDIHVHWLSLSNPEWGCPYQLIKALRRIETDTFALGVQSLEGRRNPVILKALTLIPRAHHRLVLDQDGRRIRCSRTAFILTDLPLLAVRAAASAILILISYLALLLIRWAAGIKRNGMGSIR